MKMTFTQVCVIVLVAFLSATNCLDRNSTCITPNQETAICISIHDCPILKAAIDSQNLTLIEFAKQAQCGYDTDPLVCCGSTVVATPILNPYDIFTRRPLVAIKPAPVRKPVNLNFISTTSLPDRTLCGLERETPRLIGGTKTAIDEFPWMALIKFKDERDRDIGFKCGGTLINNRFVLTAAHCVLTAPEKFVPFSVRLGEWQVSTDIDCVVNIALEECSDPVVDVNIEDTLPHPYYSARSGNNDIALLKLAHYVNYTDFIRPICLPPVNLPTPEIGSLMSVCGWGAIENGALSDFKLKIEIPLVANAKCAEIISKLTHISANQICAGGVEGKDACQGDSGGPLMRTYVDDDSQWYQEGVVARGRGCGKKNFPGIYTRVSRYITWIVNAIENLN